MIKFDTEFRKLKYRYEKYDIFFINDPLKEAIKGYLNEHKHKDWKLFDRFFNRFNLFWTTIAKDKQNLKLRNYKRIKHVFDNLLGIVNEWEEEDNSKIHKGTPYYYYGMASIINGDLEKGFSLIHQAAEEDRRYNRKDTPAYYFILLNSTKANQLFYPKVYHVSELLKDLINKYQEKHGMSLDITALRERFLSNSDYIEESYLFVYCIFKFNWFLEEIHINFRKNHYASYIESSLIFDICKVCESVLKKIYEGRNTTNKEWLLPKLFDELCDDTGVGLIQNDFDQGLNNDRKEMCGFHTTILLLLNEAYIFKNLPVPNEDIGYNLGMTYILRNFGGHDIKEMDIIYDNFEEIFKRVLFTFFYIVEMKL